MNMTIEIDIKVYKSYGTEYVIKRRGFLKSSLLCLYFLFLAAITLLRFKGVPDAVLIVAVVALLYVICVQWQSESVLAVAAVGINVKITNRLGLVQAEFFELGQIKDVVIIEAISMQSVICYLAIILNGSEERDEKVYPLFMNSKPSLEVLKTVYKDIHKILQYPNNANKCS